MAAFDCHGWLYITITENPPSTWTAYIRVTHTQDHPPYVDVSLPDDVKEMIRRGKDIPMKKVFSIFVTE